MAGRYSASYRSEGKNVATARRAVANFARSCGFSARDVMEIELAAGEALSNAVQHGRQRQGATFSVRCECDANGISIEVRDNGRGFIRHAAEVIDPELGLPLRGFGITLMRSLMNEVTYSDNGSTVRLVRRFNEARRNGNGHN